MDLVIFALIMIPLCAYGFWLAGQGKTGEKKDKKEKSNQINLLGN